MKWVSQSGNLTCFNVYPISISPLPRCEQYASPWTTPNIMSDSYHDGLLPLRPWAKMHLSYANYFFFRSLTPPEKEAIKRILVQYTVIYRKTNYYNEDKTANDSVTWPATWLHPVHLCFLWHHALMPALEVVPVASGAAVPKTLQGSMLGGWQPSASLYSFPWVEEMWGKHKAGGSTPT